ncbi:A disintegrin and metalloproteinase with thrombospondin motifs 7-like [Gordionus sp. m RMFG-2023]|uniref:A disintegrin and metalloproteinase with thrombospondin motifs 7-like n=1 Tax=Gordionus sp. m RMFG-2023 TaxID=3053472 RepID=UPI0031FD8E20
MSDLTLRLGDECMDMLLLLKCNKKQINYVNYLFQDQSLGVPINIIVTHVFLFQKNPSSIPITLRDAERLLDAGNIFFIKVKRKRMGLQWDTLSWVTGLNLYSLVGGQVDDSTEGLSYFGKTICNEYLSASLVEMSSGFAAIPFIAHELGHNLNFDHDQNKHCPSSFIMSAYSQDAVKNWSPCTKRDWLSFFKGPEYNCLFEMYPLTPTERSFGGLNFPGSMYSLDEQCQNSYSKQSRWNRLQKLERVCQVVQCTNTPLGATTFTALEGTRCGIRKICLSHRCLAAKGKLTTLMDSNKRSNLDSILLKDQRNAINQKNFSLININNKINIRTRMKRDTKKEKNSKFSRNFTLDLMDNSKWLMEDQKRNSLKETTKYFGQEFRQVGQKTGYPQNFLD